MTKIKQEADISLKKKEADLHALGVRIEDEQAMSNRLTRQSKENTARIIEIEDELEHERQSRAKADRARSELQRELDDLSERLDDQNHQMQAQIELNKKKDAEILKSRRDLDELNLSHEDQLGSLRKRNNDQVAQLTNQLDGLQKGKAKIDKERGVLQKELDDINVQVDQESKARVEQERLAKQYEIQVAELQQKVDEQSKQLSEFTSSKGRLLNDNGDLLRQVEELEVYLNTVNRAKAGLSSQLTEAKKAAEDETHDRHELNATCKNLEHEIEQCLEMLEEEINSKDDTQRQLSRINSEISQWKARYEGEGLVGADELEELKRKQMARVMDLQEALSAAQNKVISLEKAKARLLQDTEDARSDVDRHLTVIASLEKKQKAFDKIVEDWKRKVDDIQKEIDATTRDSRNTSTEVFKLRSAMENLTEYIETLRRENKGYAQEIRDITEQITQGSRTFHDLQKAVLRSQIEVQQIRSEVEKRIQEKEEEFENTRKNHQRALESIQASLETETKSKAELLRAKKKLESDINQLEIALDHANKANVDAQKTLKRLFDQVKELQGQVDDEQRNREEIRENYLAAEKRLAIALAETEDLVQKIDSAEKSRHQLEIDQADLKSQNNELIANNAALSSMKRKVENDVQIARNELDECLNQLKASEERSRKAASDADRLAEEVRQEQEHCAHVERHRKGLELTAKELQAKIEDAERAMLQFGQKALSKVEEKVRQVSAAYHAEARRHQEAVKGLTKQERRSRELQFQVEEDKKMFDRLQEMVEKLQQKIRVQKRQIEEAEEVATQNLSKFRQIQLALENAEERAEVAENSLVRMRTQQKQRVQ
ncbi:myosin tail [Teladorsagia circumcincta]|uniref:Myosin tail n=2 Tax=Trichostrongylidae TaxID=6315 RepID=A0A2G9V1E0_TELCI|nr:myosin tail [Teladorsagia circumcincta]